MTDDMTDRLQRSEGATGPLTAWADLPGHVIGLTEPDRRLLRELEAELATSLDGQRLEDALRTLDDMGRRLSRQDNHDALTDLPNRRWFADAVAALLDRADSSVGVALVDIDDFKLVNDALGHAVGDLILGEVAARIESELRPGDTAARVGGDEFAFVSLDSAAIKETASRILGALQEPFAVRGATVRVQASAGIAVAAGGQRAAELLRNADLAVHAAKRNGKAQLMAYTPDLSEEVVSKQQLRADLREALEGDQFEVWYQPIVEIDSTRTVGLEALLRWQSPERGMVAPAQFIGEAEMSGLIVPLERWAITRALTDLAALRLRPGWEDVFVSINASARHLMEDDYVEHLLGEIDRLRLPADAVVIELTETLMIEQSTSVLGRLNRLRVAGLRLAFDDFGTGYSSLAYLRSFPVDLLKIAQPFVDDLRRGSDAPDPPFAAAIMMLGESLGLGMIAEGIEDEVQLERLTALGCEFGQGFLFAPPMPVDRLADHRVQIDLRPTTDSPENVR